MIQNMIFYLVELPAIHECCEMTICIISATKCGRDFDEDIVSIFYVSVDLKVMRAGMYCLYMIYLMRVRRCFSSSCYVNVASFSPNPFAMASPCRFERYVLSNFKISIN